ncbi:MAG TPA: Wzt carbohydrate-binding domain-containing protein, partial [Acidimicrobiales bacterium]|nr:Wzt carbohydrate-binding domain-containing protein [Acidimicrobiales bacterium]
FGLAIETLDGTWLWAHGTREGGPIPDEISGKGSLELRFDRFMLQPGTYDISASINDYTCTHIVDYMRRCLRFDVVHGDPRETGGYVALGGKWSPLTAETS